MTDYEPPAEVALIGARFRIEELERILRHFDRASLHLLHYVRAVDGLPDADTWRMVVEQIEEMTDPDGPRNPYR